MSINFSYCQTLEGCGGRQLNGLVKTRFLSYMFGKVSGEQDLKWEYGKELPDLPFGVENDIDFYTDIANKKMLLLNWGDILIVGVPRENGYKPKCVSENCKKKCPTCEYPQVTIPDDVIESII